MTFKRSAHWLHKNTTTVEDEDMLLDLKDHLLFFFFTKNNRDIGPFCLVTGAPILDLSWLQVHQKIFWASNVSAKKGIYNHFHAYIVGLPLWNDHCVLATTGTQTVHVQVINIAKSSLLFPSITRKTFERYWEQQVTMSRQQTDVIRALLHHGDGGVGINN